MWKRVLLLDGRGEKEDNCDMIQIIYASAATKPFTRGDLVVRKNSI